MTGLLRDVMHERAEAQGPPVVDLDAILSGGNRRIRHRRVGGLVAATALVAALVGAASLVHLPRDPGPRVAGGAALATRGLTYATGHEIHAGASRLDTGEKVRSYVPTDDGFVWTVASGAVFFGDGTTTERIGRTSRDGSYLKSDDTGSLVAWIDFADQGPATLVVYDTAARETVLTSTQGTSEGMSSLRDGKRAAYVYAVDDGSVYWHNDHGAVRTEVSTGQDTVLGDVNAFAVTDVANGLLAYTPPDRAVSTEEQGMLVGRTLTSGRRMPHQGNAYLSPDGTYLSFEDADEMFVTRTADGTDATPRVDGLDFHAVYAWIDDDTTAVLGIRRVADQWETKPVPLVFLTCTVSTGSCTEQAEVTARMGEFALPTGEVLES